MADISNQATHKQIEFIKSLCERLDLDPDRFNFAEMTKLVAGRVIDEMLKKV